MTESRYGRALAAWIITGMLSAREEAEEVREEAHGYNAQKEAVCG